MKREFRILSGVPSISGCSFQAFTGTLSENKPGLPKVDPEKKKIKVAVRPAAMGY